MTAAQPEPGTGAWHPFTGSSLEMTGRDIPALMAATPVIRPGTQVNVTFLGTEDPALRVAAASAVKEAGFAPVPHISARRLASATELGEFLGALEQHGASEHVFAVGGDPASPLGPYPDTLSLITSGLLEDHGVHKVSIAGYPGGHPGIDRATLWSVLEAKQGALAERGLDGEIITQFGFDTAPVLDWLTELRHRGIGLPVRIGVPGPTGVKRLLGYARRFGVTASASMAGRYGFRLSGLLGTAGPERFIQELAAAYEPSRHGEIHLHFYTFGGLAATADWVAGQH